LEKSALTL